MTHWVKPEELRGEGPGMTCIGGHASAENCAACPMGRKEREQRARRLEQEMRIERETRIHEQAERRRAELKGWPVRSW